MLRILTSLSILFFSNTIYASSENLLPYIPSAKEISSKLDSPKSKCQNSSKKIAGSDLGVCYKTHPFFLELLILTTDEDFNDSTKSSSRKLMLAKEIKQNKKSISECYDKFIQYSQEQADSENQIYVKKRLSEMAVELAR